MTSIGLYGTVRYSNGDLDPRPHMMISVAEAE